MDAEALEKLGFHKEAEALIRQAHRSIYNVEKQQQFSLTLAQCDDYPRQPEPTDSTPVRVLRDQIALGDKLINGVQSATEALDEAEIAAHIRAISQRQETLKAALKRQLDVLSTLYEIRLDSQEKLHEALTKISHLRKIFVGTPDEDDVSELAVQLQRILSDVGSWETGDVSVERLEELLTLQIEHQLATIQEFLEDKEIDPAWDISTIYKAIVRERLEAACRRSAEWIQPRLALAQQKTSLDRQSCAALAQELADAPAYLSAQHAAQVRELLHSAQCRLAELDELKRNTKVVAWQRRYLHLADIEQLDRHATEQLLQELRDPPCELRSEEQVELAPIFNRLTAHLDQMSMEELFARIERLDEPRQRQLLDRLSALLAG